MYSKIYETKQIKLKDLNFSIDGLMMLFSTYEQIEIKLKKEDPKTFKKIYGHYDPIDYSYKSLD